jgi:hypothetical protein
VSINEIAKQLQQTISLHPWMKYQHQVPGNDDWIGKNRNINGRAVEATTVLANLAIAVDGVMMLVGMYKAATKIAVVGAAAIAVVRADATAMLEHTQFKQWTVQWWQMIWKRQLQQWWTEQRWRLAWSVV